MVGLRTYFIAFLMALVPSAVTYFTNLDWVAFLQTVGIPQAWALPLAGVVSASVMAVMRSITSTPPGKSA